MTVAAIKPVNHKKNKSRQLELIERRPVSVRDIAGYCMVSPGTVRRWFQAGKLKSIKLPSSQNRVSAADFRDFLKRYNIPVSEDFFQRL
jgi:hypothetical protein